MPPNIPIPVTLYPNRAKAGMLFFVCLLFVAGGVWMVYRGNKMGYPSGGFFALGLPIFALQFHPKSAYLRLEPEGFTFCSLFRAHRVEWSAVSEFGVMDVGLHRIVAWNFTPGFRVAHNGGAFSRSICALPI